MKRADSELQELFRPVLDMKEANLEVTASKSVKSANLPPFLEDKNQFETPTCLKSQL